MKAAVLLMVVVAAAVAVPIQWLELEPAKTLHKSSRLGDVYSFCNKSLDPLVITSLSLVPDPPKEGQPVTLSLTYDLNEKVTGGEIKVQAKLDNIPVYSGTLDLCDTIVQAGMTCPIAPTETGKYSTSFSIPTIAGHVSANAVVTDQDGKELACVDLDLNL